MSKVSQTIRRSLLSPKPRTENKLIKTTKVGNLRAAINVPSATRFAEDDVPWYTHRKSRKENTFRHVVRSNAVVDGGRQKGKENTGYILLCVFEVRPILICFLIVLSVSNDNWRALPLDASRANG